MSKSNLSKTHYYDLLKAAIETLDNKNFTKAGIFERIFPNDEEKRAWVGKWRDISSNEKGLTNSKFFYDRILSVFRHELSSADNPNIILEKTIDEKLETLSQDVKKMLEMMETLKSKTD